MSRWLSSIALYRAGVIEGTGGDRDEAEAMLSESLRIQAAIGLGPAAVLCIRAIAAFAWRQGDAERAATLYAAACAEAGGPAPCDDDEHDWPLAEIRAGADAKVEAAWAAGRGLSLAAAVEVALRRDQDRVV